MIHKFYPSAGHKAWASYVPPSHTPPLLQGPGNVVTELRPKTVVVDPDDDDTITPEVEASSRELFRATRLGISVEEYRTRCKMVEHESNSFKMQIGDTCWPTQTKALNELGQCLVVNVCRHYDSYGDIEWNNPPFIVMISPLKNRDSVVNCTIGYVEKREEAHSGC